MTTSEAEASAEVKEAQDALSAKWTAEQRVRDAAPDLLAALETAITEIEAQIYSHCEDVGIKPSAERIDSNKAVIQARAAIARAKMEEKR